MMPHIGSGCPDGNQNRLRAQTRPIRHTFKCPTKGQSIPRKSLCRTMGIYLVCDLSEYHLLRDPPTHPKTRNTDTLAPVCPERRFPGIPSASTTHAPSENPLDPGTRPLRPLRHSGLRRTTRSNRSGRDRRTQDGSQLHPGLWRHLQPRSHRTPRSPCS